MRNPVKKFVDPLEMLASDHETVKLLFEQCEQAGPGMKRRLLTQEIFKNLELHATLEEEVFYPAIQRHLSYEEGAVVRDAFREHRQIKDLIRQLEAMDDEDAAFSSKMAALREEVQTHAEKEEQRIFPLAERSLPMNDVAFAMDKRRFQLMVQKPAPSVVAMLAFGLVAAGFLMFMFGRRRESWR